MRKRPLSGTTTPFRFGVNFSYYGLTLDLSGLGLNVYQTQLLFGAVELPSKLLVYLSVRHTGRRLTQAGMLLGRALTFAIRLLVSTGEPAGPARAETPPPCKKSRPPRAKTLPGIQGTLDYPTSLLEPLSLQRPGPGPPPWR
jgi:hypothetical protein